MLWKQYARKGVNANGLVGEIACCYVIGMTQGITIRTAQPADAAVIARFNAEMALETEHKRLNPRKLRAGVEHAIANPESARYFLAEADGRVVGQLMITFEWSDWRDGNFWWIQSVYVEPTYRSRGVFKALYRHVEQLARECGNACGLRLYVETENARAQEVYRRMGMREAGYVVFETDWSKSEPTR